MPDEKEPWDVVLRRVLDAARQRYEKEMDEDRRGFDLDAAQELLRNLGHAHPQLTITWLLATVDLLAYKMGDDLVTPRNAETAAYYALRHAQRGLH